ncbi:MAG: efflux RND transporter periplasmic adaptor subunit, partial [Chryseolinea sp.]
KPEMFAIGTVDSKVNAKTSSITIPKTAVMWTGKRSVVYEMRSTDQGISFIMREVTLGPELGESYVIESGLKPGEEIAVNGTFSIDAAAQLAGKPSMMNPQGGKQSAGSMPGMDMGEDKKTPTNEP